jgi:hypothetical protein
MHSRVKFESFVTHLSHALYIGVYQAFGVVNKYLFWHCK